MINSRSQSHLALDVTDKFLTGILRYINLQCKDSQLNNFRFLIHICFLIIIKYHLIESCFSLTAPLHWIYCLPLDLQNVKYRQNSGMYERVDFFPGHNNFDKGAHHSLRRIHAPVPALRADAYVSLPKFDEPLFLFWSIAFLICPIYPSI